MYLFISVNRLRLGFLGLVAGALLVFNGCASTQIKEDVDAALLEPEQTSEVAEQEEAAISVESIPPSQL